MTMTPNLETVARRKISAFHRDAVKLSPPPGRPILTTRSTWRYRDARQSPSCTVHVGLGGLSCAGGRTAEIATKSTSVIRLDHWKYTSGRAIWSRQRDTSPDWTHVASKF
ncbi:uncharacterized protein LOC132261978 [Phlebotomus argentipes]|uniref:uncharacterized protein LOC132261978 n=1 Tax=Phlebotomus argentipes TaxID=94469 RepID=UPI00289359C4|nr:uncharacterized protein LOC132261978 [Phlebotomus argentipes]